MQREKDLKSLFIQKPGLNLIAINSNPTKTIIISIRFGRREIPKRNLVSQGISRRFASLDMNRFMEESPILIKS